MGIPRSRHDIRLAASRGRYFVSARRSAFRSSAAPVDLSAQSNLIGGPEPVNVRGRPGRPDRRLGNGDCEPASVTDCAAEPDTAPVRGPAGRRVMTGNASGGQAQAGRSPASPPPWPPAGTAGRTSQCATPGRTWDQPVVTPIKAGTPASECSRDVLATWPCLMVVARVRGEWPAYRGGRCRALAACPGEAGGTSAVLLRAGLAGRLPRLAGDGY